MLSATVALVGWEVRLDARASLSHRVPLDDERAVVLRAQRGDRVAAAQLYAWFREPAWRTIVARCPDRTKAEDALRDTFRKVLERLGSYTPRDGTSIEAWIRTIAVHCAMDVHRADQRDRRLEDRVAADDPPSGGFARPDRALEREDTARDVERSLALLHPRYAEVLRLRLLEERPREACAELLGITVGNLDVLLHRAAKAFRKVYPP